MAFGNVSTFYFPALANAGSSQWGSDVRKLLDSPDASADSSTTQSHGTGGDTRRTIDPYTGGTSGNNTESEYGWAVTPADMNSVSGALRYIPAGDHVATIRMAHSAALGDTSAQLHMFVYRVGPSPGFARTLLGSSDNNISLPGGGSPATVTATVALPEIVLEEGETLQYSFEVTASGQALSGATSTFYTGTQGGVAVRIDHPGLGVLAQGDGSSQGSATAQGDTAKVIGASGEATAASSASADANWIASGVGSSAGQSGSSVSAGSIWESTGQAAGEATSNIETSKVLGAVGTVDVSTGGGGTTVRPVFIVHES